MSRFASAVEPLIPHSPWCEGPAFDRDGNLYYVNWDSSSIMRRSPDGHVSEFHNTGGIPAGLAFHPDGSLYVADEGEHIHGVIRITMDGQSTVVVDSFDGAPLNGANDLVFDRNGVLYFSDPWGSSADNPIGGFYRWFPEGRLERIDSGLAFPNGLALTADGSAVILAETYRNRLLRYPIAADGAVGPREHWADVALPSGPDGMALDERGDLYVAHYGGGSIDVFDPGGKLVETLAIPGPDVTNCAFGGPDNKTLVITEISTATVYQVRTHAAGQPVHADHGRI